MVWEVVKARYCLIRAPACPSPAHQVPVLMDRRLRGPPWLGLSCQVSLALLQAGATLPSTLVLPASSTPASLRGPAQHLPLVVHTLRCPSASSDVPRGQPGLLPPFVVFLTDRQPWLTAHTLPSPHRDHSC